MGSKYFLGIFLFIQLVLVFAHIHQSSMYLRLSYEKQRSEKMRDDLRDHRNRVAQEIEVIKNSASIKKYAIEHGMVPVDLKQVKRVDDLV